MKKGAVTDGGLWEEGWGWLMVEGDPVGRGPSPEGCNYVSSNPWERESLASRGSADRGTCDLQIR